MLMSWATHIFHIFMDLMPPFVRMPIFRMVLGAMGRRCMIEYGVYLRYPWLIHIGDDVKLNRNGSFYPSYLHRAPIHIGNRVTIAYDVSFIGGSHDHSSLALEDIGAPITIEDDVWVGCRVVFLPGVTVGKGAVIGAGTVVNKDIPPYTIVGGVPAKLLKERTLS